MYTYVPKELWMMLPAEERDILIEQFDLKRTSYIEVNDNRVIQDGFSNADLSVITAEAMAEYVGDSIETPFPRLWELTVAKAHSIVHPPNGVMESEESVITITESEPMVVDDAIEDVSGGAIIEPKSTTHAKPEKTAKK